MKKIISGFALFLTMTLSSYAQALYTELGATYGRKTTTFDQENSYDAETITGSVSIYFLERMALELSYTDGTNLKKEKASLTDPRRTTTQKSQVLGADLILIFADKKALFQPYIKGGGAQIKRSQVTVIEGSGSSSIEPETATVPSYGAGLKVQLTETFGLRFSYDVWKTPLDGGMQTDDSSIRAGVTWVL